MNKKKCISILTSVLLCFSLSRKKTGKASQLEEDEEDSDDEEESEDEEDDEEGDDEDEDDDEEEDKVEGFTDDNQAWLQLAKEKGQVKVQALSDLMDGSDEEDDDDEDVVSVSL